MSGLLERVKALSLGDSDEALRRQRLIREAFEEYEKSKKYGQHGGGFAAGYERGSDHGPRSRLHCSYLGEIAAHFIDGHVRLGELDPFLIGYIARSSVSGLRTGVKYLIGGNQSSETIETGKKFIEDGLNAIVMTEQLEYSSVEEAIVEIAKELAGSGNREDVKYFERALEESVRKFESNVKSKQLNLPFSESDWRLFGIQK